MNDHFGTARMPGHPSEAMLPLINELLLLPNRPQQAAALQSMAEALDRLAMRMWEVIDREREFRLKSRGITTPSAQLAAQSGHQSQMRLVDAIEGFHQHVYAALSSVAKALNATLPHGLRTQMPGKSVTKWMDWFEAKSLRKVGSTDWSVLRRSVDLRSKVIDHPQQHKHYTWMSMVLDDRATIVWYQPLGDGSVSFVPLTAETGLFDPRLKLPVNHELKIVPADPRTTHEAAEHVATAALEWALALGRAS